MSSQQLNYVRPSWREYFIKIASITSERSACKRLKVGCVIVKDNRIISQGYNGYLPGCPHEQRIRDGHEIATVHAEQNAIADCAKRGANCNESTAYITHYPCMNCIKVLLAAGIKEVFYLNDYKNDSEVEYISNLVNVKILKIIT